MGAERPRTIVVGLGNPILTDDGIGPKVAQAVEKALQGRHDVTVVEASVGGLELMELLVGYDRAVLIDAIMTCTGRCGDIYRLSLDQIEGALPTQNTASAHDMNLNTALRLGRALGLSLPQEVVVLAVEAGDVATFGEACTPPVQAAIPRVVDIVLAALRP